MFRYWLQGGRITVGFLGGAQIDRFANLNTTVVGAYDKPKVRLPGGGGAPEIATSCGEIFIIMKQTQTRLCRRSSTSSPRSATARAATTARGSASRPRGRRKLITDLCVLRAGSGDQGNDRGLACIRASRASRSRQATGWPVRYANDGRGDAAADAQRTRRRCANSRRAPRARTARPSVMEFRSSCPKPLSATPSARRSAATADALAKVRTDDLAAVADQGADEAASEGRLVASSTSVYSAAPTRPARTTATSRAWRCCSRACRTSIPGITINRLCASGLNAVGAAAQAIRAGEIDLAIAGGVESMTRAPFVMGKASEAFPAQPTRSTTPPSAGASSIR